MPQKLLTVTLILALLYGCKKLDSAKPNNPPVPLGEKLYNPGDSTGSSMVYGISKNQDNNIVITGVKDLYNSAVGYVSYYPLRFVLDHNSLKVLSTGAPLLNKYGTGTQSRQSGKYIYSLLTLTNSNGYPVDQVELVKTDTGQNIIWEKVFDKITNTTSLEILSDGDLLIQGNYGSDLTASTNPLVLLRLDANGNTIFKKQYAGQFSGSCFDILEETNDFALMAFSPAYSSVYSQILYPALQKVDFSGNPISSAPPNKFFLSGSWHFFTSFHLINKAKGGYIVTSTYVDTAGGVANENFYLNLLNPDGSIQKTANLWITGTPVFRVADVIQTQNGNIYALLCLNTGTDYVTQILEYDAAGNFLNAAGFSPDRYPMGLLEVENNNIIMVQTYPAAHLVSVTKLDQNLKIL